MSQTFYVVNTVRSIHTRLARSQSPTRHRFKQYILGGSTRLVRARPVPITDKQLFKFEDELRGKVESGAIQIHRDTPDGPLYVFGEKVETKEEPKEEPKNVAPEPKQEPEVVKVAERVEEEEFPPPPPLPVTKRKKLKKGSKK